ncbi:MAG TPA: hypothetical protein EYQ66_03380, partial [Myxococcales bacterium]|nr:hypothetical protein [Myxococcales bacterium]
MGGGVRGRGGAEGEREGKGEREGEREGEGRGEGDAEGEERGGAGARAGARTGEGSGNSAPWADSGPMTAKEIPIHRCHAGGRGLESNSGPRAVLGDGAGSVRGR